MYSVGHVFVFEIVYVWPCAFGCAFVYAFGYVFGYAFACVV